MNGKKILKMDDEAMQNVVGGQGDHSATMEDAFLPFDMAGKLTDSDTIYLTCPECGGSLNIMTTRGSTVEGVCPHCHKPFSITV